MMREQVLVSTVKIMKAGQSKHFQIKLPKDTAHIIGVETGVRFISALEKQSEKLSGFHPKFAYKRNKLIGELKLQSCEQANIFYALHIQTDENLTLGDCSLKGQWTAPVYTHLMKAEEDNVKVDGESTIVQGLFKDRIGQDSKADMEYTVTIYVWITIKEGTIR